MDTKFRLSCLWFRNHWVT